MGTLIIPCLLAAASGSGTLVGLAPLLNGTRAAVTIDPATGSPTLLVPINNSLGWFNDNSATADNQHGVYYVATSDYFSSSYILKIDVASQRLLGQYQYQTQIGLLAFDNSAGTLYGVVSGKTMFSNCVLKLSPDTMRASQLGCLPDGWVVFTGGLAVHEASQVVYAMAANINNASISYACIFGLDASTGKVVSQAHHPYGTSASEIIWTLTYDTSRAQIIGLCSGVQYIPGKHWKGYYTCTQDLTGAVAKTTPIGDPGIFADGPPPGATQLPYPTISGYGVPNRSYYVGFYFPPPAPPPTPPSPGWQPATNCQPSCNTTFSSCCKDPMSGQDQGICMGYPTNPITDCSKIHDMHASVHAAPRTLPPWLFTIDIDSGNVASLAKQHFPDGVAHLVYVPNSARPLDRSEGHMPKTTAAAAHAKSAMSTAPTSRRPIPSGSARPRIGLGNRLILPRFATSRKAT